MQSRAPVQLQGHSRVYFRVHSQVRAQVPWRAPAGPLSRWVAAGCWQTLAPALWMALQLLATAPKVALQGAVG
jgi:hypothetical protein